MKKTQLYIISFLLLALSSISFAQEDTWTRKTDMPTPRLNLSTSVVGGKIYAIGGGKDIYSLQDYSTVEEYNPATDTWIRKADMPTPRGAHSASVVDGKVYVIGGGGALSDGAMESFLDFPPLSTVEVYDPATDTWAKKADMPTARGALSTSVVNGRIYAIGGVTTTKPTTTISTLSTVEEYDPTTDTWTKKADIPIPRQGLSTSVVNGKIYAIGGSAGGVVSTVEEYDPVTDIWTKKTNMPTPRWFLSTSVVNDRIYAIGGGGVDDYYAPSPVLSTVEVYDPETDTWTKKTDMFTPRAQFSASAVNGYIYAIGGTPTFCYGVYKSCVPLSTVEEYDTGIGIRVTTISPQEGRVTGGEPIAVFGSGFPSDAIVTIGGKSLTELKVTDTLIMGITPSGTEGEQNILITAPSLDFTVFAGKFIYLPLSNLVVTAITPNNGKQAGGDRGSITGSGFLQGATVTVGGAPATDVVVTSTLIIFTIPPGVEGTKDVVVTNTDGQKGTLRGGYTYNPFPIIEDIEPPYGGPIAGGTSITITGSNFMQGVIVVIGGERVQRLDFFSPTELRLRTPPGTVGRKDVRVVNPDGQEAVLKDGFTYNPAPTIASVSPNAGPLEGGTEITITGTRFFGWAEVLIGGAEASASLVSPTKIKAETPPSTAGVKDVVVINPDGQEAILEAGFTYNPAPAITKVIPDNGRLAGGTKITLQGNGFLPGAKVLISVDINISTLVVASAIQVMSPNLITAVTPAGEPGPTDVVVRNPDRQEIVLPGGFIYNPLPKITDVSPSNGPASGGTPITVRGTGFLQGARVIIGKRAATTEWKDEATLEAVTPANPQGVWDVRVVNPDTQEAVKTQGFTAVGELVYNFPNPFRAEQGTTFRYVTNEKVELIKVQIFNLAGVPIGVVGRSGSNEVRWYDPSVHAGLYVYRVDVTLEGGKMKSFKRALEVYK
ncbi:hypothetical protein FJZ31_03030 [Candidatus Poribacteria bacterium]|nr:hypothetical protein [Candidatus Poribacteria bacterium]